MPKNFKRARRDRLVQLAALVPVLATLLASVEAVLPELRGVLSPWVYAGVSVAVSTLVGVLRLRALAREDSQ